MQFKEGGNQPLRDGANRFIVNFSSVSARQGNVGQIDYTAAKGAIEAATRTTAREFAGYGARVNAIAPGPVRTPMLAAVGEQGIAMMAAANRPAELRVHLKGALKNGCTPEEIREILLLVALYCGIPAANEAHRAAMDVLKEEKAI